MSPMTKEFQTTLRRFEREERERSTGKPREKKPMDEKAIETEVERRTEAAREQVEQRLREAFEDGLDERVDEILEAQREKTAEQLREAFEEEIDEQVDAALESEAEAIEEKVREEVESAS